MDPADKVESLDELTMEDDERPFYGWTCKAGFQKESSLTALEPGWRSYILCPREGCLYNKDKPFSDLRALRRHYRYTCHAPGGPQHDCTCTDGTCETYVLDDGPKIPTDGYMQVRYDGGRSKKEKVTRSGWKYKPFLQEYNEYDIVNQWQPAGADPDVVEEIIDQCKEQLAEVRDKTRLYEAVLDKVVEATEKSFAELNADYQSMKEQYAQFVTDNAKLMQHHQHIVAATSTCTDCSSKVSSILMADPIRPRTLCEEEEGERTEGEDDEEESVQHDQDQLTNEAGPSSAV